MHHPEQEKAPRGAGTPTGGTTNVSGKLDCILTDEWVDGKHLFRYVYIDGLALRVLKWLEVAIRWNAHFRVNRYAPGERQTPGPTLPADGMIAPVA